MMGSTYDVVVVGAGHAGIEAALAASRLGCRTVCLTANLDSIGLMPCNPSIGGPAKANLVREIDALGGHMGIASDATLIQLKTLNTSKGPAVRALRAQVDKVRYHLHMKAALEAEPNLEVRQLVVERLLVHGDEVQGVVCRGGLEVRGRAVVLTTGTYLRGRVYVGSCDFDGGPNGQLAPGVLSDHLKALGLEVARFKTGTPARVNGRSINYGRTVEQPGDALQSGFSFLGGPVDGRQVSCWLTYTNVETHDVIMRNIHSAPMFSGAITGRGPRYCPSIESKVVNFPEKERHQVFLEPEGLGSSEYYLGGLSTSLPEGVQDAFLRTIPGLESVEILRYGYAIEYDVVLPHQLTRWLEVKSLANLFTAGQVNGTSGYEEAAAQGLVAGVNAARRVQGLEPAVLERHEAYIGVLVDDLVTKEIDEPYRMLTTRAEYRVLLRQDNADARLSPVGRAWGLVSDERMRTLERKQAMVAQELERLRGTLVGVPGSEGAERMRLSELLRRPEYTYEGTSVVDDGRPALPGEVVEQVEVDLKYSGYVKKQLDQVERVRRHEGRHLLGVDFAGVRGLSSEAREKLCRISPDTLGQASRIAGVGSADLSALLVHLVKGERSQARRTGVYNGE